MTIQENIKVGNMFHVANDHTKYYISNISHAGIIKLIRLGESEEYKLLHELLSLIKINDRNKQYVEAMEHNLEQLLGPQWQYIEKEYIFMNTECFQLNNFTCIGTYK